MIKIGGIVENTNLTLFRLTSVADKPGSAGKILRYFAEKRINLEYITESSTSDGTAVMAICVSEKLSEKLDRFLEEFKEIDPTLRIIKIKNVSVLGIYGPHFREKPALAAKFCQTLGSADINILGLSSSISSICAVINAGQVSMAKKSLLKEFQLP